VLRRQTAQLHAVIPFAAWVCVFVDALADPSRVAGTDLVEDAITISIECTSLTLGRFAHIMFAWAVHQNVTRVANIETRRTAEGNLGRTHYTSILIALLVISGDAHRVKFSRRCRAYGKRNLARERDDQQTYGPFHGVVLSIDEPLDSLATQSHTLDVPVGQSRNSLVDRT
jgi:hypothetical protein